MKFFVSTIVGLILTVISATAAVPPYTAFKGIGGITVTTNPPNGDVTIDGSGISAGATPSYVITNNQSSPWNTLARVRAPNIISSNLVFVDATNATAALNGNRLSNAVQSALSVEAVVIGPGEYWIPTNASTGLGKDGVDWYVMPGARICTGTLATNESSMFTDAGGAMSFNIYGYGEFYFTNGNANALSELWYQVQNGSSFTFEYAVAHQVGGTNPCIVHLAGTLNSTTEGLTRSDGYDAFISGSSQPKGYHRSKRVYAGGSIVESSTQNDPPVESLWWNQIFDIDYGEVLSTATSLGAFVVADGVYIRCDVINLKISTSIWGGPTNAHNIGSGVLEGSVLYCLPSATHGAVQPIDGTAGTAFTLKGFDIHAPTGVDPIAVETFDDGIFTIENCFVREGASSTNWIRQAGTAGGEANVRIHNVHTLRNKPSGFNVIPAVSTRLYGNTGIASNGVLQAEVGSQIRLSGVSTNKLLMTGGSSNVTAATIDSTQFATTPLAIKDGATVTNLDSKGHSTLVTFTHSGTARGLDAYTNTSNITVEGSIISRSGSAYALLTAALGFDTSIDNFAFIWNAVTTVMSLSTNTSTIVSNLTVGGTNTMLQARITGPATNSILRTGAGGAVVPVTIGANLSLAADGTLSASGGGTEYSSITNMYLEGSAIGNFPIGLRMSNSPSITFVSHTSPADHSIVSYKPSVTGTFTDIRATTVSNNHPVLIGGIIYGTNQHWVTNLTANFTFNDPDGILPDIPYMVKMSNVAYTVAFPASWTWLKNTNPPAMTNGVFHLVVQKTTYGTKLVTNAWLAVEPEATFAVAGPRQALHTNAVLNIVTHSNALSLASEVIAGAGNGNTNYTFVTTTNSLNDFYLGSSNVNIVANMYFPLGYPVYWNAYITNLSANTWGISFSAVTNRWRFAGVNGTNAPTVLTNDTCLMLSCRSDGTNTLVGYTYYRPGL